MQQAGVRAVRLTGGGEPLFRKDAVELIGALGRRGIRVSDVTTNAVLLTEPVVRALYAAGCDEIHVSINTAEPDSYAAMMQTTEKNFGRVVENVQRAARIKTETGSDCALRLQFLIYKDNFRQIPRMHRLFRESGADTFWFNGLFPVRPMPAMTDAEIDEMLRLYEGVLAEDLFVRFTGFSFWERAISERIAASSRAALARAPLSRRLRARANKPLSERAGRGLSKLHEFCLIGWYSTSINANGDVVPCCILQDRKNAVLGNIYRQALSEIWEGVAYRRFRAELSDIMARRGAKSDFSGACVVEEVCVKKDACPNRSFYWSDDAAFRRRFHRLVEEMPEPAAAPFSRARPSALPVSEPISRTSPAPSTPGPPPRRSPRSNPARSGREPPRRLGSGACWSASGAG